MSEILVTSDEHYGHGRSRLGNGGILHLAHRPFSSLEEMKEVLIERHNKKVPNNRNHLTIHVGDMFWQTLGLGEALDILDRLHGRHAFIFGNHDELIQKYREAFELKFEFIIGENEASGTKIIRWNKHKIFLTHFAPRVWPGSHKGHWALYGHSHNALPGLGKSLDIGVDGHNFEPWTLEEIEKHMESIPQHHYIDNTGRVGGVDTVEERWP